MSNFLTVEDINTNLLNYVNEIYTCDTGLIDDSKGINHVQYDFIYVTRNRTNGNYLYSFEIHNDLWCGGYYFTDENGNYLDVTATINNKTISANNLPDNVKLHLYLCSFATSFSLKKLTWIPSDFNIQVRNYTQNKVFRVPVVNLIGATSSLIGQTFNIKGKAQYAGETTFNDNLEFYDYESQVYLWSQQMGTYGLVTCTYNNCVFYFFVDFSKTELTFNIDVSNVIVGKINRLELNLPRFVLNLDDNFFNDNFVRYNDVEIPIIRKGNDPTKYYFDLDLSDKIDINSISFDVVVNEKRQVRGRVYNYEGIHCKYLSVMSESELRSELGNGIKVLELGADISLTSNIQINSDVIIHGNDKQLTLNNHSIILNEGVKLIVENAELNIGNPAIIQKENSNLELTNVKFTNNTSTEYNNLGSCIFCDVDLESLSVDSDFTTNINECTFVNNHNAIFHGGQLTVDNCRYLNNDLTYVDKDNPGFLYQVDGDAEIINSIFDINYTDNTLCENHTNIGYAQALVRCGLTATINTATHESLQEDNKLPFFENYRNQSHVFAKYYYPQIETCVFTSPVENKENESICYCVTGTDWVYKTNAVVTRADWQNENTINNIDWEEI